MAELEIVPRPEQRQACAPEDLSNVSGSDESEEEEFTSIELVPAIPVQELVQYQSYRYWYRYRYDFPYHWCPSERGFQPSFLPASLRGKYVRQLYVDGSRMNRTRVDAVSLGFRRGPPALGDTTLPRGDVLDTLDLPFYMFTLKRDLARLTAIDLVEYGWC